MADARGWRLRRRIGSHWATCQKIDEIFEKKGRHEPTTNEQLTPTNSTYYQRYEMTSIEDRIGMCEGAVAEKAVADNGNLFIHFMRQTPDDVTHTTVTNSTSPCAYETSSHRACPRGQRAPEEIMQTCPRQQ